MKNRPKSKKQSVEKKPIIAKQNESFLNDYPYWSFKKTDNTFYKWQIGDAKELVSELKAYEGLTWNEILSASGGKKKGRGTNNHSIQISELIQEAQKRLVELNFDNEDVIFSLRISARKRLWGFRQGNILEIVWFDTNHEIYPITD